MKAIRALVPLTLVVCAGPRLPAQDFPHGRIRGSLPDLDPTVVFRLDSLSPPAESDTIHVVSPWQGSPRSRALGGTLLPRDVRDYFREYYPVGYPVRDPEIYAVRRYPVGPGFVGYLLRVPGMYSSSVIDLWVLDREHGRWLPPLELADDWGDAGEWFHSEAWLFDVDGDGYRDAVKRAKHGFWEQCFFDKLRVWTFHRAGFTPSRDVTDPALLRRFDFELPCG